MTGTSGAHAAAKTSEGSVSFSLKELMRLEDERVAFEKSEAKRRADEREREAAEAARRADEAVKARAREEDEARHREEERMRAEAARLEGMQRAIVERERVSASARAREDEMGRLRAHEIELARIQREARGSGKAAWIVAALASAALLSSVVAYATVLAPRAEVRVSEAHAETRTQAEAVARANDRLADLDRRVDGLSSQLKESEDRARDLERQLEEAKKSAGGKPFATPSSAAHRPATVQTRPTGLIDGPCKNPRDPLCAGQ